MRCPFPDCGRALEGLGTFCHGCGRYAADFGVQAAPAPRQPAALKDGRSEKEIQAATKKALEVLGFEVWDTSQPFAAAITPGVPDLIVAGRGVVAFIEMKSANGTQSDAQAFFQMMVEANGGTYLLARSEADVIAWAEGIGMRRAS